MYEMVLFWVAVEFFVYRFTVDVLCCVVCWNPPVVQAVER
jgi:hypothetical protein